MKLIFRILVCLCPWELKRRLLARFWGYDLHPTARIGFAYIYPEKMRMGAASRIGHLTVVVRLRELDMGVHSLIGRLNWISAYPLGGKDFFTQDKNRYPSLRVGDHAAITNRHLIDCTDTVTVGRFSTMAGFRSQILTHSIDLMNCRQASGPVLIGEYCFVGTGCILLAGSVLPDRCVLGAGSTLTRAYNETHTLYAGLPAISKKRLSPDAKYFTREKGYVN